MTAAPVSVLRTAALVIQNEHADHANTALRVGQLFVSLIDSMGVVLAASTVTIGTPSAAAANIAALEALVTAAVSFGYGKIVLPAGVIWVTQGSFLATVCLQLGVTVSNVWICGAGEGITTLKLADGGNSHVINLDGCTNVKITDLTLDGNRDNNTTTSWHALRTGSLGVNGLTIERVTAQSARGYGFGMQGGNKKRLRMINCTAQDTGLDGCDFKNNSDNSEDIVIVAFSVRRWGLDLSVTEQAGLDCRGPCQVNGFWGSEGPADGHYLRLREGELIDPSLGGQYSHVTNFICEGNSGTTSLGVYLAAHDVHVSGGYVSDMLLGVNFQGERASAAGITVESCDDESFQVNVAAENARITDCHSLTATGSGFRIRAPRCKMKGCSSGGDAVTGVVTEATAVGFETQGFDCEGTGGSMGGVDINSADAVVIGGDISGCFRGLSTIAARTRFIAVNSHNNTDKGCLIGVGGDGSVASLCMLVSNANDGLELRADNCRILGNDIIANGVTGLDIIAGGDNNTIDDNLFASNVGAAFGDAGAGNQVGLGNRGLPSPYLFSSVKRLAGTGSPEGVHAAPVGSTYARTDGGAGTSQYFKEGGGTGNTGWVAK